MKNLSNNSKGFSLVELMVVIVIIAILAAVAIPMYRNYNERAEMVGAINSIGGIKAEIEDDANNNLDMSTKTYPAPIGISVINATTSVATININMSEVAPNRFSNEHDVLRLVGSPDADGALFTWECLHNSNASDLTTRNVPTTCQGTY
ncbi:MAG: type IV pilus assembly protein PilA [Francisella sp.]|jgi:type IV pilus assembly protein PilA